MTRSIGDLSGVTDGWLQEFAIRCDAELDDDCITPERREFVADAADRIEAEMRKRGIARHTAKVIPFRRRAD